MVQVLSITIVLSFWNGISTPGPGPGYLGPRADSLLRAGIQATLLQNYDSAQASFRLLTRENPGDPLGPVFEAGVIQTLAMDYEEFIPGPDHDSLIGRARDLAEILIEENPESAWHHFLLGTALGSDAFARAKRGDWFGAATSGMSSADAFESALEADSSLVDAYAGLGTYYYWKARKLSFLTWLPFVADKREEGIRLLEYCSRNGIYNRHAALSALIGIYSDRKEYGKAVETAERALMDYPNNRIFLWGLATALERSNQRERAVTAYRRLRDAMKSDERPNNYNELVCRLNLLALSQESLDPEAFRRELAALRELAEREYPEHLAERVHEKLGRIHALETQPKSAHR